MSDSFENERVVSIRVEVLMKIEWKLKWNASVVKDKNEYDDDRRMNA
jgi:hypothetical protein